MVALTCCRYLVGGAASIPGPSHALSPPLLRKQLRLWKRLPLSALGAASEVAGPPLLLPK